MYSSSAASSTCSNISNLNGAVTVLSSAKGTSHCINDDGVQSGSFSIKAEQSQRSQISLRLGYLISGRS